MVYWVAWVCGGEGVATKSPREGDSVDFWRVEEVKPNHSLLLRAEMKLPGRAWLQFALRPAVSGGTLLRCSAWFEPRGIAGEIYWWGLYPVHVMIFRGLVKAIQQRAEVSFRSRDDSPTP